ncbi:hypothetical protein EMGBD4_00030 [Verrucomicrobiota bacterium]|nr:hypothetical protein EMGBD4_00030 [Verrucomicrobiota bacterium]
MANSKSELKTKALVTLADLLLKRDLHPKDRFEEAFELLKRVAASKDALAQAMLAELYAEGRPPLLTSDSTKAAELRELSLADGKPEVKSFLLQSEQARARKAANAVKTTPDYIKAMLLAVQRGHPQALTELGLSHLHFEGFENTSLPLDLAKAAQNLAPGALASDSLALMGLGLTYQKSKRPTQSIQAPPEGGQQWRPAAGPALGGGGLRTRPRHAVDLIEADKWYQLASRSKQAGSVAARKRIEAKMTAEQLLEARRRAEAYKPLKAIPAEAATPPTPAK